MPFGIFKKWNSREQINEEEAEKKADVTEAGEGTDGPVTIEISVKETIDLSGEFDGEVESGKAASEENTQADETPGESMVVHDLNEDGTRKEAEPVKESDGEGANGEIRGSNEVKAESEVPAEETKDDVAGETKDSDTKEGEGGDKDETTGDEQGTEGATEDGQEKGKGKKGHKKRHGKCSVQ